VISQPSRDRADQTKNRHQRTVQSERGGDRAPLSRFMERTLLAAVADHVTAGAANEATNSFILEPGGVEPPTGRGAAGLSVRSFIYNSLRA
jgi:hypothetical protein